MRVMTMVLTAALFWTGTALADPPAGYPFVGYDAGLKAARASGKPIFLYFGRYGCAWCDHTNRKTFSDAALKTLYSENYVLVYVDAESGKRLTLPSGERITEAETTGAQALVTACPWCERNFRDAISTQDSAMQVLDIVDLVHRAVYGESG